MRRLHRYAICILVLCVLGCGNDDMMKSVSLDRQFSLQVGQEAHISSEGLSLMMLSVPEDSRCPRDVACVWAGNATVRFEAVKINESPEIVEVNTNLQRGPVEAKYASYTVKLMDLAPLPKSGGTIEQGDYRAGLIVTKQ